MVSSSADHTFAFPTSLPEVVEEGIPLDNSISASKNDPFQHPSSLYEAFSPQSHQHHVSISTTASGSTSSSPTTTLSSADDSSVTEMTPESSPESPVPRHMVGSRGSNDGKTSDEGSQARSLPQSASFFEMQRPSTPGKRPRNLKNLAVNTGGAAGGLRSTTTTLPKAITQSEEVAPPLQGPPIAAFRRPPSPHKRRPCNLSLTLVTPGIQASLPDVPSAVVPPTPSVGRPNTLRHFQSSPALPQASPQRSMKSPLVLTNLARPNYERTQSEVPLRTMSDDMNFELPQSREDKPDAYPDGPICIFDPYIDLYLEPSAEEAAKYDVVINVAAEVRNPFRAYSTPDPTKGTLRVDGGGGMQSPPPSGPRMTVEPFNSVLRASADSNTVLTEKATPSNDTSSKYPTPGVNSPEYIHMLWEHNSDLVPDLPRLVKLIDERVKQRKRILIHCQCGVSRSATLCVAYSLYLSPHQSVQQAYDIVKARSKWIGPNMHLIMQLQEFSTTLAGAALSGARRGVGLRSLTPIESSGSWNTWRRSEPAPSTRLSSDEPNTAPLPPQTPNAIIEESRALTPGPSSAPSGLLWPVQSSVARSTSVPSPIQPTIDTAAAIGKQTLRADTTLGVPLRASASITSPRSEEFAMSGLQPSADIAADDHFGIMSPSTSSFSHGPLNREALLSSLGMGAAVHDTSRRQTHNFSFPLRKPLNAPTALQVATGAFTVMQNRKLPGSLAIPSSPGNGSSDSLLSPRAAAFTVNPFSGQPAQVLSARTSEDSDPRSPAHKGSNPIIRNIADMM